jgi:hypothetical protein
MLRGPEEVPTGLFGWICGQISDGGQQKREGVKEISGDGVSGVIAEKSDFWAVATPL